MIFLSFLKLHPHTCKHTHECSIEKWNGRLICGCEREVIVIEMLDFIIYGHWLRSPKRQHATSLLSIWAIIGVDKIIKWVFMFSQFIMTFFSIFPPNFVYLLIRVRDIFHLNNLCCDRIKLIELTVVIHIERKKERENRDKTNCLVQWNTNTKFDNLSATSKWWLKRFTIVCKIVHVCMTLSCIYFSHLVA